MTSAPLLLQRTSTQRLLVRGIFALTNQLVRSVASGKQSDLPQLMSERHRLLRELGISVRDDRALGCLAAITAAVQESDRALEAMVQH